MHRSWAALLVCATVWLVSCVDDNPVVPDQTYDAAEELAKETFNNDAWLDRTVKPCANSSDSSSSAMPLSGTYIALTRICLTG